MSNLKYTDHVLNILLLNNSYYIIFIFVFIIWSFQFKHDQIRREGTRRTLFENVNKCVTSMSRIYCKCFETANAKRK